MRILFRIPRTLVKRTTLPSVENKISELGSEIFDIKKVQGSGVGLLSRALVYAKYHQRWAA